MSFKGKTALLLTQARPIFIVLVLVILGIILLPALIRQLDTIKLRSIITPTPTPFKYSKFSIPAPLPTGKQVYNVSRGSGSKGPVIERVTIDSFDPKKGEMQKISIKILNSIVVNTVKVTVTTDYEVKTYDATLKSGTVKDGIWEAVAASNDTHNYVYRVVAEAEDVKDKFAVTITIR